MSAIVTLLLAAWLGLDLPGEGARVPGWLVPPPVFKPRGREVTNWRWEAVRHLALPWPTAVQLAAGREAAAVSRCVRLNNYWCIKRAGWAGEIAADAEGHVAFASAQEGADVAALLLRRYYLDFGRRSALAIVSRWAPASCGVAAPGGARLARADHLATRGLGRTLRARFLASRGRRVAGRAGQLHRSRVAERPVEQLRAPAIAVGLGERPAAPAGVGSTGSVLAAAVGAPVAACAGDTVRLRAYAGHAAAGLARSTTDDLGLFAADGTPTPNLARLLLNMAAVEIGPLGARTALVERAVAHLADQPRVPVPPAGR